MPERMLRWHYRSRHPSLIAVSNREFYDDRLHVVPSPFASHERLGLAVPPRRRRALRARRQRDQPAGGRGGRAGGDRACPRHARAVARRRLLLAAPARRDPASARASLARGAAGGARVLRQRQGRAVLRQEPRDDPGRRARRDPDLGRLRPRPERPSRDELRPAQPRRRRAPAQRPDHPRPRAARGVRLDHRGRHRPRARARPRRGGAEDLPRLCRDRRAGDRPRDRAGLRLAVRGRGRARAEPGSGIEVDSQIGVAGFFVDLAIRDPAPPGPLSARHRMRWRGLPQRVVGARSRPAAPAGAGGSGLDPAAGLERGLAARSRGRAGSDRGGAGGRQGALGGARREPRGGGRVRRGR